MADEEWTVTQASVGAFEMLRELFQIMAQR